MLLYIAVFWAVQDYCAERGPDKIITALVLGMGLVVGTSLFLGAAHPAAWARSIGRLNGLLENPNSLGLFISVLFPLVTYRVLSKPNRYNILLLAAVILSLVLCASRTAFLSLAASGAYLLAKRGAVRSAIAGLSVCVLLVWAGPHFMAHLQAEQDEMASLRQRLQGGIGTGSGRLEAWSAATALIEDHLWLGHGFGTEDKAFENITFTEHEGAHVHNGFLGLTYQLGLVGSAIFFLPLLMLLAASVVENRGIPFGPAQALEAVLIGGFVTSFFESWIYSAGNSFTFPFWICVMLLCRHRSTALEPLPERPRRRGRKLPRHASTEIEPEAGAEPEPETLNNRRQYAPRNRFRDRWRSNGRWPSPPRDPDPTTDPEHEQSRDQPTSSRRPFRPRNTRPERAARPGRDENGT